LNQTRFELNRVRAGTGLELNLNDAKLKRNWGGGDLTAPEPKETGGH